MSYPGTNDPRDYEEPTCLLCRNVKEEAGEGEVTLCPYCDAMTPTKWRLPVLMERDDVDVWDYED